MTAKALHILRLQLALVGLLAFALAVSGCGDESSKSGPDTTTDAVDDVSSDATPDVTPDTTPTDMGGDTGDTTDADVVTATCGDGRVDIENGETCDDGNTTSGDGCSDMCRGEMCGNDNVDPGEECDGTPECDANCIVDADGDTIADAVETLDDADMDGTPNAGDTDSDGDGILDADEAGDADSVTPPIDTDMDGTPDYLDTDANGDGIDDVDQGTGDLDMDGIPDYLDSDVDGDGLSNVDEGIADPDMDMIPAYRDLDSDGDGIPDADEGLGDPDMDMIGNFLDSDSDGDTIDDSVEGVVDTDTDGTPDYLDTDSDGDSIGDIIELTGDVDMDMIPDYLDLDSDGDGIDDGIEGEGDVDMDGVLNFRDLDADGDGIPDPTDGTGDADFDMVPNFLDLDSDGDTIPDAIEAGPDPTMPVDTDMDMSPDFLDLDSDADLVSDANEAASGTSPTNPDTDGDTINDFDEGTVDTDMDGTIDALDTDSDNDGVSDLDEAGDSLLNTPAVNTDGNGNPDYLDRDSDDDGILDGDEVFCATLMRQARLFVDTDMDGFSDLAETAIGSNVCDAASGVTDIVEFYFELPYQGAADNDVLVFQPSVQQADVFFSMDTTYSMSGEIANLQSGMSTPTTGIIDQTRTRVTDSAFGVGNWEDFPICGFGHPFFPFGGQNLIDLPWALLQAPTTNTALAQTGVNNLELGYGVDGPESGYESLYQLATGAGTSWLNDPSLDPGDTQPNFVAAYTGPGVGGAGFRAGSLPIVLHITDANTHTRADYLSCGYAIGSQIHTKQEAFTALNNIGARVITVQSGSSSSVRTELNEISSSTNGVVPVCAFKTGASTWRCGANQCCTGLNGAAQSPTAGECTLTYNIASNGSGLSTAVVDGIDAIVKYTTFEVFTDPTDDGDSMTIDTSCFIKRVESLAFVPPPAEPEASCTPIAVPAAFNMAAYNNGFSNFASGTSSSSVPGSQLHFTVNAENDTCAPSTTSPQLFTAFIDVIDDTTGQVLDTQTVVILVPPEPIID